MTWERIPADCWREQRGHVERYELAAGWIKPGDSVLDVACGIGYGATVLAEQAPHHTYLGVDRQTPELLDPEQYIVADLDHWQPLAVFDVAVCFETLEHLVNPERLARLLLQARRLVIASVPTIPTKASNPWHLHDFTVQSALALFTTGRLLQVISQPHEFSHIFIISTEEET